MGYFRELFNSVGAHMGTVQMSETTNDIVNSDIVKERISVLQHGAFTVLVGSIGAISIDMWIKYLTLALLILQIARFVSTWISFTWCRIFKKDKSDGTSASV